MSDHSRQEPVPGPGDTGRGAAPLERAEVAPLIRALVDPAEPVRTAAWRALVRLPLGRELWYEASERMLALLAVAPTGDRPDRPAAPGIPREELIEAAARLPTQAVRRRLRE